MTIEEIKALCTDQPNPPPAVDPNAPNGDMTRPWWVVVVNPRRQPAVPKFYKGHVGKASAEATAAAQQKIADDQAAKETQIRGKEWKPFRYFALARPKGGVL